MGTEVTIDLKECCQMAGVPYTQTYEYSPSDDENDYDADYIGIDRVGDSFSITSTFRDGWVTDGAPLVRIFERLREDLNKITVATRKWTEMKRKNGDCNFLCTVKESVFECNNFIVTMEHVWAPGASKKIVKATVENTKTHDRSEHVLAEISADAAAAAIKLHLAEAAEIAEEKA